MVSRLEIKALKANAAEEFAIHLLSASATMRRISSTSRIKTISLVRRWFRQSDTVSPLIMRGAFSPPPSFFPVKLVWTTRLLCRRRLHSAFGAKKKNGSSAFPG